MAVAARRHEVTIARIVEDGARVDISGVRVLELGGKSRERSYCPDDLGLLPRLERIVSEVAPDVVHAGPLTSAGWIAALIGGAPMVAVSWGFDLLEEARESEAARWVSRLALRESRAILCDCRVVRDAVAAELPVGEIGKIITFPWGVERAALPGLDVSGLVPEAFRRTFGKIVLSARAWEPHYGIEIALEAFRMARARRVDLGLVLAGGGGRASWIRQFVAENRLNESVLVVGKVSEAELAALYSVSDVYLSCVPSDGSSLSLLGAMAAGIPAIVAEAPGNREWVLEGETGLFAPAGDPAGFADRILRVASWAQEAIDHCREASRAIVRERADWTRHSETLLGVYDDVCRRSHSKRSENARQER